MSMGARQGVQQAYEPLENYCALGSLRLDEPHCLPTPGASEGDPWTEVHQAQEIPLDPNLNTQHINRLLNAGWIKFLFNGHVVRAYVLPHDVSRSRIPRDRSDLREFLRGLLPYVDTSASTWGGDVSKKPEPFDPWASPEELSLFYLFNTLPSPDPQPQRIKDVYSKKAALALLDPEFEIRGLRTSLFPYQARSAALMLQRETSPALNLDPRLEQRSGPDGRRFYYNARETQFMKNPSEYEQSRGGILAETMGLGKTIICLAVILSTKGHLPQIPPEHATSPKPRENVPTLKDLCVSTINRHSIPWKWHFDQVAYDQDRYFPTCTRALEQNPPLYEIPAQTNSADSRLRRVFTGRPSETLRLCSGTIIIVPKNLLHQWTAEIKKHVVDGEDGLRVLVADGPKQLPSVNELATYDIILFSRTRFEAEIKDGSDAKGRRKQAGSPLSCACPYIGSTRIRDCTCLRDDELYQSPLKKLHWLRVIVDEGHQMTSETSRAAVVANKLVRAERRWVVSGTPAKDRLVGVEVEISANDTGDLSDFETFDPISARNMILEKRRKFAGREDGLIGAARNLGLLATHFLKSRPWSDQAEWEDIVYRHTHFKKRTFDGFSKAFSQVLEGLMVKTRHEDVEKDVSLPPLHHRVIRLEPSYYDKLTANLFIQVVRSNAITSERTDQDFLFHKNSVSARHNLVTNLAQSNFAWTGFSVEDVEKTIATSEKYLAKEDTNCSPEDAKMLKESVAIVKECLASTIWISMSRTHEIGMFVEEWPGESAEAWSWDTNPLTIGVTQLLQAQSFVNSKLTSPDPTEGFRAEGEAAKFAAFEAEESKRKKNQEKTTQNEAAMEEKGIPLSAMRDAPTAPRLPKGGKPLTPRKKDTKPAHPSPRNGEPPSPTTKRKRQEEQAAVELPASSPLSRTNIIGTTSAKLSYLLDQVSKLHRDEKILIFFDGDNAAYYLAQGLETLHITHLIYAKSLNNEQRSRYIVSFDRDDSIRVLLMDIRCGALGLNVNAASRVFFINPVNRPSIEAQAVKRAHRIGQTKPVVVETLVLKGTMEEQIFERAKTMSTNEHNNAKTLEDDQGIKDIILNAPVVPVREDEGQGYSQIARLPTPQRVFARSGRGNARIKGIDDWEDEQKPRKKQVNASRTGTPAASGVH